MAKRTPQAERTTEPGGNVRLDWAHVVESLEQGVIAFDVAGNVSFMNQAAEQLTGSSLSACRGQHHSRVFAKNPWVSAMLGSAADDGHIRAEGDIVGQWDSRTAVRATASPVLDSRGNRGGIALVLHDLSLQRGLESDLHRAQSLDTLGGLVAGLAHEIKNPLSGIRGAVQLLGADGGTRAREYVDLVIREVDRLTGLVERLLELGSRRGLELSGLNVHRVIDHVVRLTGPGAERDRVQVTRLFDPSLPPVAGHEDSLVQVFLNLVQNAIAAVAGLPPETAREVRIHTRMETGFHAATRTDGGRGRTHCLRIDVEDNGPGVAPQVRDRLFSPFVTTKPKGTGLGLAISHRIVTDHGGTIRFESGEGRTVFRVILPVWEAD
ncbi:MAG: two-component system, NtrC family, nitrogen regulation sensor histidine kinase GlnL [Candidatus Binatota bacterium]|jgi:two-component system nitrogen regulation sensor histidine kinase GlnL|nr:two-component system, NtrC family, nitrogen regulation sensor histidine kinase GlnL [Candidatus Binatota bacterium]